MPERQQRRYWDSAAFVALIRGEAGRAENCRKLIEEAAAGRYQIVTATITLAEVTRKRHEGVDPSLRRTIEDFFENDYITLVEIDRLLAIRARDLIWDYRSLRPNDALHAASAIETECVLMYTYDDGLQKLSGRLGGLRIEEPVWVGQADLGL